MAGAHWSSFVLFFPCLHPFFLKGALRYLVKGGGVFACFLGEEIDRDLELKLDVSFVERLFFGI